MVNYRRNFAPSGTYFFTVNLRDRHSRQLTRSIEVLRQAFRKTLHAQPFSCDAIVILPDHLQSCIEAILLNNLISQLQKFV